mgnify:CR=1 FL=1
MLNLFLFLSFVSFGFVNDKAICDTDIDHIRFSYAGEDVKPFYQIIFLSADSKFSEYKDHPFVKTVTLTKPELNRVAAIIDSVKITENTYDLAKGPYSFQVVSDKSSRNIVVGYKNTILQIFRDVSSVILQKENKEEVEEIFKITLLRLGIKEEI